jgi:hypothetical protein
MHGTFRGRIENRAGVTVRFDARLSDGAPKRRWRARWAALLAGGCVAALPMTSQPIWDAGKHPPVRSKRAAPRAEVAVAGDFIANPAAAPAESVIPPPARRPAPAASVPSPVASDIEPAEAVQGPAPLAIPRFAIAPLAAPPVAVNLPDPAVRLAAAEPVAAPPPAETAGAPPADALRPVDVPQLADSEVRSLRVPQLHEPRVVAGGEATLAAKIAAMQVTPLPPVRLRESDRAALLAEAPTRMMLRIGGSALGKVDFRMTDARTIDVKLSGLLDLLAGHYDAGEFARLRNSAAADAFVSFDQLRALGLNVRYDAVYDELRISG